MIAFFLSPIGKLLGVIGLVLLAYFGFRMWLDNHDAGVLAGYVTETELTATKALLLEAQRQRTAALQAVTEASKRQQADDLAQQAAQAQTDIEMAQYEQKLAAANRRCLIDADDLRFLQSH